jgi:hypothetical protein
MGQVRGVVLLAAALIVALLWAPQVEGALARRVLLPVARIDPTAPPPGTAFYLVYGQSNSIGHGARPQAYYGTPDRALLLRDPAGASSRSYWTPLADPFQLGAGGSWVPRLASRLSGGEPVAFAPAGHDGYPIEYLVPGWGWYEYRLLPQARAAPVPVRAVLYWQGETDAAQGLDAAAYRAKLAALALAVKRDLAAPLVVAEIGPPPPGVDPAGVRSIRAAQRACWVSCENVVRGPSFADIAQVSTEDWHFSSDDELALAADRWYEALVAVRVAR